MPNYHNIEKSVFRWREYVGWDCKGERYAIRKNGPRKEHGPWWVYPQTPNGIPCFYAGTLKLVSLRLEQRTSISALVEKAADFTPYWPWEPPPL